jgi:ribulose-phosphate 3-epimerase
MQAPTSSPSTPSPVRICTGRSSSSSRSNATLKRKAGIALNPATPPAVVPPVLGDVDLILVMTVNPGFGGQGFIASQTEKIREIRALIDATGRAVDLEVDGGINVQTARTATAAGADVLVAGTATFSGGPASYAANIRRLRDGA